MDKLNPLISVIVPVYKVEPYLRKCLDSIIHQTYTQLDIILVDDGSPDGCPAICDEYAERDPRVRVIHKSNGGQSSARNAGLDFMRGDYFAFVDSDDSLEPGCYMKVVNVLCEHPEQEVIRFGYKCLYLNGRVKVRLMPQLVGASREKHLRMHASDTFNDSAVCYTLFKKSVVGNLRFQEGFIEEDVDYTLAAYYLSSDFYFIPEALYNYVAERPGQITRRNTDEGLLDQLICLDEREKAFGGDAEYAKLTNSRRVVRIRRALYDKGNPKKSGRLKLLYPYILKARKYPYYSKNTSRHFKLWLCIHYPMLYYYLIEIPKSWVSSIPR